MAKGKEEKKESVEEIVETSPAEVSPSGSPCTCKEKRDIMCVLHGG